MKAYEARQSRIRAGLYLAMVSLLPAAFLLVGLRNWSTLYPVFLAGLVLEAIAVAGVLDRVRGALRRERLFVIDAKGVHLGRDEYDRPARHEPWSRIDLVVHFKGQVWTGEDPKPMRHVGIVRAGKIVNYRAMTGWSLNVDRAAAAAARFGGGTPVVEAPFQRTVPVPWHHTLPLPEEWLAAQARPGS
jgi:hypothetical protein